MTSSESLSQFTVDVASVIPIVDAETTGQYGPGLGSESEPRQVQLILDALQERTNGYEHVSREVEYPDRNARCDLRLPDGTPVEVKLLRYWRANGDPEPHMYTHVFSPFSSNTLLTDARRLATSTFEQHGGLLGLFYERRSSDSTTVRESPDLFTAEKLAEKVIHDLEFWYGIDARICRLESVDGLRHPVHQRGTVITWVLDHN